MRRSIDKREFSRLKTVNFHIEYRLKGSDAVSTVEVIDLSTGGLCFLRKTIINKGDFIQIKFPFSSRRVLVNAQVVRLDGREVGVKFTDDEAAVERLITAFNDEYPAIKKKNHRGDERLFGEKYEEIKSLRSGKGGPDTPDSDQ